LPLAFTRAVSPRLDQGELTHIERVPIDMARARAQHGAYERALTAAGLTVHRLAPLPDAPDGVFVEDGAIVLGAHAVITRPGAPSRRSETASTAQGLAQHLEVHPLEGGRLDGGDVLLVGRTLYVGASLRTDGAGIAALKQAAAPLGYAVTAVEVRGCLHLKTCATHAGHDPAVFAGVETLCVAPKDADAANTVRAGDTLIIAAGHPALSDALAARGFTLAELNTGEFRKAEAALSCLSLIAMEAG
jgi:dimethylargininase